MTAAFFVDSAAEELDGEEILNFFDDHTGEFDEPQEQEITAEVIHELVFATVDKDELSPEQYQELLATEASLIEEFIGKD